MSYFFTSCNLTTLHEIIFFIKISTKNLKQTIVLYYANKIRGDKKIFMINSNEKNFFD